MDEVALYIGKHKITDWNSYSVWSSLFAVSSTFELEFSNPEHPVRKGQECRLYVNGRPELMGIIEQAEASYDKSGSRLSVKGRDLMGQMVDCCVEEFESISNITFPDLARRLLGKLEYLKGRELYIIRGIGEKKKLPVGTPIPMVQLSPGQTVFEVLKANAPSAAYIFRQQANGDIVFLFPRFSGRPEFTLERKRNGSGNIEKGKKSEDLSREFSTVTALGQTQSAAAGESETNGAATLNNPAVSMHRPYVTSATSSGLSAEAVATRELRRQQFEAFSLEYTVSGHGQNGLNWAVNSICRVDDEMPNFNVHESFLVHTRTFRRTREGTTTDLVLSPLKARPA